MDVHYSFLETGIVRCLSGRFGGFGVWHFGGGATRRLFLFRSRLARTVANRFQFESGIEYRILRVLQCCVVFGTK